MGSAETVDVLVVGGGVIGVATAWCCAEAGLSVRLLERASLAAEASGRNQGLVIGPHPPAMAQLAEAGLRRYLELHEVSGGAFAFDRDDHGCLLVSEGAGDAATIPGAGHAADDPAPTATSWSATTCAPSSPSSAPASTRRCCCPPDGSTPARWWSPWPPPPGGPARTCAPAAR